MRNRSGRHPVSAFAGSVLPALIGVVALLGPARPQPGPDAVDLALVLAVDCSYSVDEREFELQIEGLAQALLHPAVVSAITAGPNGRIAVAVVQWSGAATQKLVVPWRIVAGEADAAGLAASIRLGGRQVPVGATSITAAIDFSRRLLLSAPFTAQRRTIDVVADGINNVGGTVDAARDRAAASGITINGLAVENEVAYLWFWLRNHVVVGDNAFAISAASYEAFGRTFLIKLLREIRPEIM